MVQHDEQAQELEASGGERFLSDVQVADRYDVGRSTIWAWVAKGRLPAPLKFSPGCSRFRLSALRAAEKRMERES